MSAGDYDLVVIGGGIHGVGAAQAAAAAGHSVLLLERAALASGTSSRSSKLIHGGLRYLESGQLRLVHESLAERETLLRVAPGLVRLVPFHIPIYRRTVRRPWQIRLGLSLYALLGGLARTARFETVARAQWDALDGLETDGLQQVFRYRDAQTDDAALTRAVMRSAQELGAELRCPAEFLSAARTAQGYAVRYAAAAGEAACTARALVNAAGPWVNAVLDRITPAPAKRPVELVQGAHLVLAGKLEHGVYYVEAPRDRRAVFAMPWNGGTLIGTTETKYTGDPAAVRPLPEEIEYLRETYRRYFPRRDDRPLQSFAGVRVLPLEPGAVFHRTRETLLAADDARAPRLITIYGGKLTGYRLTAARALGRLAAALPARSPRADTATLKLGPG